MARKHSKKARGKVTSARRKVRETTQIRVLMSVIAWLVARHPLGEEGVTIPYAELLHGPDLVMSHREDVVGPHGELGKVLTLRTEHPDASGAHALVRALNERGISPDVLLGVLSGKLPA